MSTGDSMFERMYTVSDEHADKNGVLKVATLMKWLNDIMEENANSYGAGADYHLRRNLAWVLAEYQIDIDCLPKVGEKVKVGTLPYSFKRMFGYRLYRVCDEVENPIVKGKGKFLLIDIKTKQMVRPAPELLAKFTDAKKEPESLAFPKWNADKEKQVTRETMEISEDMADANAHVNNAEYVRIAETVLQGYDLSNIEGIRVRYKKEVFPGDTVSVAAYTGESGLVVTFEKDGELVNEILFQR